MTEFLLRQFNLILGAIEDYRNDDLSLYRLIGILEGLGNAIDDDTLNGGVFETAWDLERINSELIDKKRLASPFEHEKILSSLERLEVIIKGMKSA